LFSSSNAIRKLESLIRTEDPINSRIFWSHCIRNFRLYD